MPGKNIPQDTMKEAVSKEVQLKMCLVVKVLVIQMPVSTCGLCLHTIFFIRKISLDIKDFELRGPSGANMLR